MKVGTKSILFGVHAFWIHPFVVALAWWKLYGFPWDPRLWVAFFVHDLGYWGKPNMDGPEGKRHPELGARIMWALFDKHRTHVWFEKLSPGAAQLKFIVHHEWFNFSLYHSRSYARSADAKPSRLAHADKLAWSFEPWWLYLPRAWASGELAEYMREAKGSAFYVGDSPRQWYARLQEYGKRAAEAGVQGGDMGVALEGER